MLRRVRAVFITLFVLAFACSPFSDGGVVGKCRFARVDMFKLEYKLCPVRI